MVEGRVVEDAEAVGRKRHAEAVAKIKAAFAEGADIMREAMTKARQFDKLGDKDFLHTKSQIICACVLTCLMSLGLASYAIFAVFRVESAAGAGTRIMNIDGSTWPILFVTLLCMLTATLSILTGLATKCESGKLLLLFYILLFLIAGALLLASCVCLLLKDYIEAELAATTGVEINAASEGQVDSDVTGVTSVSMAMLICGASGIALFLLTVYVLLELSAFLHDEGLCRS